MGGGLNARGDAEEDVSPSPPLSREPIQKIQLMEAVYHESAHLFSQAELYLLFSLVITVKVDLVRRKSTSESHIKFSTSGDIHEKPLLPNDLAYRHSAEGFRGIDNLSILLQMAESLYILLTFSSDSLFIHHKERGAVLVSQVDQITPPHFQMAPSVNGGS
jgi:hypothetical protein